MTIDRNTRARRLVLAYVCALAICAAALPATADARRNLYVTVPTTTKVRAYDIDSTTGALSQVGSGFNASATGDHLVVDPTGKRLYVATSAGIHAYDINSATGALTQINGSPFGVGTFKGMAIDPGGEWLYTTNSAAATVHVYDIDPSTGALAPVSSAVPGTFPMGVVVDRTGRHLYVAVNLSASVAAYDIDQSTGALTGIAGSPFATGGSPFDLTLDPAGTHLYATDDGNSGVDVFDVNPSTGALAVIDGSPFGANVNPKGISITPGGSHAYVAVNAGDFVSGYDIVPSTGALAPLGSPFGTGTGPVGTAITPIGNHLYVANEGGGISAYGISSSTGTLSEIAGSPFVPSVGVRNISITPAQPPVASFSVAAASAGAATSFNASTSSDDGTVARYDWDFGDGQTASNGGAVPSHVYANPGSYTATLTATDDEGCSTTLVWAGTTAYCNGSSVANASSTVTVPSAPPSALVLSGLSLSPRRFRVQRTGPVTRTLKAATASKRKSKKKSTGGVRISYRLSEAARVKFTFQRTLTGRRKGKKCVKARKSLRRAKKCALYRSAGSIARSGKSGLNRFWYSGRVGKRVLKPDRYRLMAVASSGTRTSRPGYKAFAVSARSRARR